MGRSLTAVATDVTRIHHDPRDVGVLLPSVTSVLRRYLLEMSLADVVDHDPEDLSPAVEGRLFAAFRDPQVHAPSDMQLITTAREQVRASTGAERDVYEAIQARSGQPTPS